jgi:putative Mg2+ transporter-C (MgtC) family protein
MGELTRVIQGVATGIGFIGAGSILKLSSERDIQGLTTAAGLWVTSAVGVAAGLGRLGGAILTVLLAWVTLRMLLLLDYRLKGPPATHGSAPRDS